MGLAIKYFGQAKLSDIEILEDKFNVEIPEDYKNFLLQSNGGQNVNYQNENRVRISQIDETINIDIMFGTKTGIKNADIEQWTSEYQEDIFNKSILIGDTMQHGFIVFWLSDDENQGIYYYDDSYEFDSSNDLNNAYYLSPTFSDFLGLIQN